VHAAADKQIDTQTYRQTDTQTRVTTIHFASSTTHAKCNKQNDVEVFDYVTIHKWSIYCVQTLMWQGLSLTDSEQSLLFSSGTISINFITDVSSSILKQQKNRNKSLVDNWPIDWIKVIHSTRHKIGHLKDVLQASLLAWYGKLNLTRQKHTLTNQNKRTTT